LRTRRRLVLGGVLVAAFAAIAALTAPGQIENKIAPRTTIVSELDDAPRTVAEQSYLDGLKPYLGILIGEGRELQSLGNARSRNVIELSLRMDRYRAAAADISQYVRDNPAPPQLAQYVTELQHEIEESMSAIDSSIDAFRRFDWDALGDGVDAFSSAIDRIAGLAGTPIADQPY
jgi:hypothetical protein